MFIASINKHLNRKRKWFIFDFQISHGETELSQDLASQIIEHFNCYVVLAVNQKLPNSLNIQRTNVKLKTVQCDLNNRNDAMQLSNKFPTINLIIDNGCHESFDNGESCHDFIDSVNHGLIQYLNVNTIAMYSN